MRRYSAQNKQEFEPQGRFQRTQKKQPINQEDNHQTENNPSENREGDDNQPPNSNPRLTKKRQMEYIYDNFMNRSQYTAANKAKATIKYLQDRDKSKKLRKLSQEHKIEKQFIRMQHERILQNFREARKIYLMQLAAKERILEDKFQKLKHKDERQCMKRIRRRSQSTKPTKSLSKLYELEEKEILLRKRGQTCELQILRNEKQKLKNECKKEQKKVFQLIISQQNKAIQQKQTKRYHSFMHRIEEHHRDAQRILRRQQHRIKQKFKNIFRKLQHDQKMDFSSLCL